MNDAQVRSVAIYGGFTAQFRKIHRSGWHDVCVNGQVQTYDTQEQAENAAYQALLKHIFGDGIVRDGETVLAAKANAESHFTKIFPGKGRKPFTVERVRR